MKTGIATPGGREFRPGAWLVVPNDESNKSIGNGPAARRRQATGAPAAAKPKP